MTRKNIIQWKIQNGGVCNGDVVLDQLDRLNSMSV